MTIEEKRKKIRRACYRLLGVPHSIHSEIFQSHELNTAFKIGMDGFMHNLLVI
jgi:hypothetical protein